VSPQVHPAVVMLLVGAASGLIVGAGLVGLVWWLT
jgi:hypothetical protein